MNPAIPTSLPSGAPALVRLTFVSECLIARDLREPAIDALLAHCSAFNDRHGVTGTLMLAGDRFVQTIEGASAAIDPLMGRIECDPRHRDVRVIDRQETPVRSFRTWSMAYWGTSLYITDAVSRVVGRDASLRDINRLHRLLQVFAAPSPAPPRT